MLSTMATHGDTCLFEEIPTVFDALAAPKINLAQYLDRIPCSFDEIISALAYVDTLINTKFITRINSLNVHRLIATALMITDKFGSDKPYTNKAWSVIAGLALEEINRMESCFLRGLRFNLLISAEKFAEYEFLLYTYSTKTGILDALTSYSERSSWPAYQQCRRLSCDGEEMEIDGDEDIFTVSPVRKSDVSQRSNLEEDNFKDLPF